MRPPNLNGSQEILNPTPATCHQAKTEVALQLLECCAAEVALQHWFFCFCHADVILTKSCAAASEKLHCNIEKAALQKSGAFLPLSCGFQAPTFRRPRLSGCAKGAAKGSCGEMVVQKGVFGESVSPLPP